MFRLACLRISNALLLRSIVVADMAQGCGGRKSSRFVAGDHGDIHQVGRPRTLYQGRHIVLNDGRTRREFHAIS